MPLPEGATPNMGVVWAAEQSEPVKRRVALKLIKPGMAEAGGKGSRFASLPDRQGALLSSTQRLLDQFGHLAGVLAANCAQRRHHVAPPLGGLVLVEFPLPFDPRDFDLEADNGL